MAFKTVIDQMGREVRIPTAPKRIVSLVPSQTELLFDLGLDEEIVGVTRFCIHPKEQTQQKTKVGGTKDFKLDRIIALKPDLIIGNKEENEKKGIEELQNHFPVWMSDIKNLEDALEMISEIGALVGKSESASKITQEIQDSFKLISNQKPSFNSALKTLYLIWKDPYMAAGQDTFINDILNRCGFQNLTSPDSRYPEFTEAELAALNPDLILLSSEPYPFKEKHIRELKMLVPGARIMLVDGEIFSWYGSRLRFSGPYIKQLIGNLLT